MWVTFATHSSSNDDATIAFDEFAIATDLDLIAAVKSMGLVIIVR